MDLYYASRRLMGGDRARRRSWAPGRVVYLVDPPAHSLSNMRRLTLLTPHGAHRYVPHSIDARAQDWEVLNGPPTNPAARGGLQG